MNAPALPLRSVAALLLLLPIAGCSAPTPEARIPHGAPAPATPRPSARTDAEVPAEPLAPADRFDLEAPIPLDPAVTIGSLDNGLTYYVRSNPKPANRASLRLLINAGSTLESDDQLGLAHFIEHMAFNGTEHFAKQELVGYLERIGMRFGADVNAYTGFDETAFLLEVPTDDPEIFDTAFQILEDWAHRIAFDPEEIEKERGVMVEEWRLGRGAAGRIRDRQLPVLFHGSRYAERLPIGKKEVLETASRDAFLQYYRDWYRPDLMAVVAVGDFDQADVIARIEKHFGAVPRPESAPARPEFPIPDHEETLSAIVSDEEATSISVSLGFKRGARAPETLGDARADLIDNIYHSMMNARLRELTLDPDPPFLFGYAGINPLSRTKSIYSLSAGVADGGVERGLSTLLLESKRVVEHGFTASELARAKTNTLRGIERLWEERDKQESASYVGGYTRHFLAQAPLPSIEFVREFFEAIVPGVELAEVNARAAQWISETNRVVLISGPDSETAGLPNRLEVLALVEATDEVAVTPWVDRTRDEPLISRAPEPGSILSERTHPELGAIQWTLSNGISVVLKPTEFKNDEVLIRGYSPGGHSLVEVEDYFSAIEATSVADEMGLGGFDPIELGKALTGKVAGVRAFIGEISEGVSGYASPDDLETLFQLLHLRFERPRRDENAFRSYLTTTRGTLENQEASPAFAFNRKWNEVSFGDHPRRRLLTLETVDEIDLDRALAIYEDRFADASDFVFTIVGSFDPERIRPHVETWLASLPAMHRNETFRDVGAYAQPGVVEFLVEKGLEPKSAVRVSFFGFADWSPLEAHLATSLAEALRIRLREVMREDLGGVYGVRVSASVRRYPRGRYNSGFSFSCDPERTEELLSAAFSEIERFKADGPSQEIVDKVRESQRRGRETALERNGFWLAALHLQQVNELPLAEILDYDSKIEAVTRASLRDAARRYFDDSSYIQGVLVPAGADGEVD